MIRSFLNKLKYVLHITLQLKFDLLTLLGVICVAYGLGLIHESLPYIFIGALCVFVGVINER